MFVNTFSNADRLMMLLATYSESAVNVSVNLTKIAMIFGYPTNQAVVDLLDNLQNTGRLRYEITDTPDIVVINNLDLKEEEDFLLCQKEQSKQFEIDQQRRAEADEKHRLLMDRFSQTFLPTKSEQTRRDLFLLLQSLMKLGRNGILRLEPNNSELSYAFRVHAEEIKVLIQHGHVSATVENKTGVFSISNETQKMVRQVSDSFDAFHREYADLAT